MESCPLQGGMTSHAALCFWDGSLRGFLRPCFFGKEGTLPAAPPGKRAQPALNGDFPQAGNPRAFLPAAKRPGGAKKAALQRFRRADTERNAGGGCVLAASWEEVGEKGPLFADGSKGGARGKHFCSPRAPPCLERSAWRFKEMIYFWRLALPFAIKATPITPGPVWAPMAAPMLPR